jgi:hypothetical protein
MYFFRSKLGEEIRNVGFSTRGTWKKSETPDFPLAVRGRNPKRRIFRSRCGEEIRNAGFNARSAGKKSEASVLTFATRREKSEASVLTLAARGRNPKLRFFRSRCGGEIRSVGFNSCGAGVKSEAPVLTVA